MAKGAYIGVAKTTYRNSLGDLTEGEVVTINEDGSPVQFYVACHNYESDLNGDGYTLVVRKNLDTKIQWSSGINTYKDSELDSWLNSTYKSQLDEKIQEKINITSFQSCDGAGTSTISTIARSVFALSLTELGKTSTNSPIEGSKIPIASLLTAEDYVNDIPTTEWTRSPAINNNYTAFYESGDGAFSAGSVTSWNNFVRPAFTLPSSIGVTDGFISGEDAEIAGSVGIAHKIKKGYIGISGMARKIKKAYIGIGGVARPCWAGGELAYYGTITSLSSTACGMGSASGTQYAIFAGGFSNPYPDSDEASTKRTVFAFDENGSMKTATTLSDFAGWPSAVAVSDVVIVAGGCGYSDNSSGGVKSAQMYSASLTKTSLTNLTDSTTKYMGHAHAGDVAYFVGGQSGVSAVSSSTRRYNSSGTKLSDLTLSIGTRHGMSGGSLGDKAIFLGGYTGTTTRKTTIVAYDSSGTEISVSATLRGHMRASTTLNGSVIFASELDTLSDEVYAFDTNLTKTSLPAQSVKREGVAATSIGEFAVIVGGKTDVLNTGRSDVVDVYDSSFTRVSTITMGTGRWYPSAETIGNYAIIAGGAIGEMSGTTAVEALTVA